MTDAIPAAPSPTPEAVADVPPLLQSLAGRFGGPRGPEFRVFPVTASGRGPKLFNFPPEAYPDADSLKAKIARDHGPGEYDVILFNEKGQTVAGGTNRVFVDEGPAPRASAAPAAAPVQVLPARSDDTDFKREFFELLKITMGRAPSEAKQIPWPAIVTAGAGALTAAGSLVVPLISKAMDRGAPPPPKDPIQALKDAMELGKQVSTMVGGAVGGKSNVYDAVMHALTEGKEMLVHLKDIAALDAANTPPAKPKLPPPAPAAAALPTPAPTPPPPPPAAAAPAGGGDGDPPDDGYAATPQGLQDLIEDHADDLLVMADEKKPARIGAGYIAVLLHQQQPHLLPIARRVLAMSGLIGAMARKDERIKARQPWFEKLRVCLAEMVAEEEVAV